MARCQADTETAKHVPGMSLQFRTRDRLLLEGILQLLHLVGAASRRVITTLRLVLPAYSPLPTAGDVSDTTTTYARPISTATSYRTSSKSISHRQSNCRCAPDSALELEGADAKTERADSRPFQPQSAITIRNEAKCRCSHIRPAGIR